MNWSFATVNGKFAEIYFERDDKNKIVTILNHGYVDRSKFMTKKEKMYIKHDLKKYRFSYRKSKYKDLNCPVGWKLVTGNFED